MKKIFPIVLLLISTVSFSQQTKSSDKEKDDIDKVCDNVMKLFTGYKLHDALELLKQHTVIPVSSIDTLEVQIESQISEIITTQYGKMVSYEFVLEQPVKNFLARRFYIVKLEKLYLKVVFVLYKSTAGWTITHFSYDEDPDELFRSK